MIERIRELIKYSRNLEAQRIQRQSANENGHYEYPIQYDPYPDSVLRSIHDEEVQFAREKTIYPIDKKDK